MYVGMCETAEKHLSGIVDWISVDQDIKRPYRRRLSGACKTDTGDWSLNLTDKRGSQMEKGRSNADRTNVISHLEYLEQRTKYSTGPCWTLQLCVI